MFDSTSNVGEHHTPVCLCLLNMAGWYCDSVTVVVCHTELCWLCCVHATTVVNSCIQKCRVDVRLLNLHMYKAR